MIQGRTPEVGAERSEADHLTGLTRAAGAPESYASRMGNQQVGEIELHLRVLSQMFDSLDPSPFHEQDLAREAEEYIIESAKEQGKRPARSLVIHLDDPAGADERRVGDAVRVHFQRRVQTLTLRLRDLLRRGWISLAIGLGFLVLFFALGQMVITSVGETPLSSLARESLLIGGWVAMWKPLEIFLYDWWPIVGERRLAAQLGAMEVRIRAARAPEGARGNS